MPPVTYVATGAAAVATAALLAYAGALVLRRGASPEARPALRMFALWWFCAAAVVLMGTSATLLALAGVRSVALQQAISYATAVPLAVGLCGLLYYLIYIYTGRASAIWPLLIAYALFFAFELYYFSSLGTRRLVETPYNVRLVGDARPATWVTLAFALLLAVPILAAVVGYASLWFRTSDAHARRRIALVSAAFAQWFGVVLLAFLLGWDRADWFALAYQAPGIVAGLLVVVAFRQ